MLPALGLIVGAYVITRMVQIVVTQPKPHPAVFFSAAITLILTLFAVLAIFAKASEFTRLLPPELR